VGRRASALKEPERSSGSSSGDCGEVSGSVNDEVAEIERSMVKLKRKLNRLLDAFAEGIIEKADLGPRAEKTRTELATMAGELKEKKLERDAVAELRLVVSRVDDFAKRIREGLEGTKWEQKREILRLLIKEVEVDETKIRVVYRVNPGPSGPSPRTDNLRHCGSRRSSALQRNQERRRVPRPWERHS
jgi:site-specific DNA recombinase